MVLDPSPPPLLHTYFLWSIWQRADFWEFLPGCTAQTSHPRQNVFKVSSPPNLLQSLLQHITKSWLWRILPDLTTVAIRLVFGTRAPLQVAKESGKRLIYLPKSPISPRKIPKFLQSRPLLIFGTRGTLKVAKEPPSFHQRYFLAKELCIFFPKFPFLTCFWFLGHLVGRQRPLHFRKRVLYFR